MSTHSCSVADTYIALPVGRIFARCWTPAQSRHTSPLVLLHDSLGCVELWRDFPEALCVATGRPVIAYDRPGYGRSDGVPDLPTLDFLSVEARMLEALLDVMGVETCALFGHSIGAEMSIAAAVHLGPRCRAVVSESAQSYLEPMTYAAITAGRAVFDDPDQMAKLEKYHGGKARWVLDAWTETWFMPEMRDWSIAPVMPQLSCPLLVIHGDRDDFATLAQPRMLQQLAGGPVQMEILADCGHIPHREQPNKVLALVAAFLAGIG